MRILFVTPYNPENYGVRCLSAQMLANGHQVHILQLKNHMSVKQREVPLHEPMMLSYTIGSFLLTDPEAFPITSVEEALFAEEIARWKPEVVGVSTFGVYQKIFPLIAHIISQSAPEAFLLAGGVGPTLDPEFFLRNGAHAVLRGEGELALTAFVEALAKRTSWRNVRNVGYLEKDELKLNPLYPPIDDLSAFPIPLHDPTYFSCIENNTLFDSTMSNTGLKKNPIIVEGQVSIITSRGCLGKCSYCSAESLQRLYKKEYPYITKLRTRTLEHIFKELHEQKRLGARKILIHDDFFVRPKKEMHTFLERYSQEIALPFAAYFHPVQLLHDPSLIAKAMHAGQETFFFGIQSGSRDLCENIYSRKFFTKEYKSLFHQIASYGANIRIQLIGGNPLETEDQFKETLEFCKLLPYDPSRKSFSGITSFYLMFFPGATLEQNFPGITKLPRSMKEFQYKAALSDIRRCATDSQFETIIRDDYYRKNPQSLDFLRRILERDSAEQYLHDKRKELQGKEVYFWGGGDMYRYKKHLFSESKPARIIIDDGYPMPETIDGIPTCRPDEALLGEKVLPIIIFSRNAREIFQRIRRKYPRFEDITLCSEL